MSMEFDRQLTEHLTAVFQEHMMGSGKAALLQISPLGQSTHDGQRDALALLAAQQETLITVLLAQVSAEARARLLKAGTVFAESLPPVEQPPPGTWDGAALLRRMSTELQRQVAQQTADLRRANELLRASEERLRALQERLREKEHLAAIGTTAAKLAHEIGNPLNGMVLATDLLERQLRKLQEDGTVLSSVRALKNQTLRLTTLLREFSVLSRHQRLTSRPTNLGDLVQEVLSAELPLYTLRGIVVEQRVMPDLPLLQVDQDKLKQVVLNLCKNAVEAMPQGGTLTVLVHNSRNQIHVEIADTGKGIPADVDIFAPFVSTKSDGSGLGLPIVQQIVDAHGGTLTYTSAPGTGTTFVVALPLQREDV